MKMTTGWAQTARTYAPKRGGLLVGLYATLLALWILVRPGGHALFLLTRDLALFAGMLAAAALCWSGVAWPGRRAGVSRSIVDALKAPQSRVPLSLGLGVLCNAIGGVIWFYYVESRSRPIPYPSWADAGYLSAYPFLLLGVLQLPVRRLSLAERARIVLDSLVVMMVAVTFSWYFILGPVVLMGHTSAFAAAVESAYPICDLVLVSSVLRLTASSRNTEQAAAIRILALALLLTVVFDSIFGYQMLHGTYLAAGLVDVGWTTSYLVLGLGVRELRQPNASQFAHSAPVRPAKSPALGPVLLPYSLVPAQCALLLYVARTRVVDPLTVGVYVGALALLGLVLLRQVLTLLENGRLYARLNDMYIDQSRDLALRVTELERLATEHERLLEREQAEHAAAESARRRLALVVDVGDLLASSLDYTLTLQRVASLALSQLADGCMVDVIGGDGSLGQVAVAHRDPRKELLVRNVRDRYPPDPDGSHMLTTVLRTGRPIVMPEATDTWLAEHTRSVEHLNVLRELGIKSYMCVPLIANGRTLGSITFLSSAPDRRYSPDDLALAQELAHRAALAVANSRLYQQAQDAIRVRDHFLLTASHDLRTPLTSIVGRADMMRMNLAGGRIPSTEWISEQVSALQAAAKRMVATIEEITDAAELQMGQSLDLRDGVVEVGAVVDAVARTLETGVAGSVPLRVNAPPGVMVKGDSARLERVLENVIGNAVKYSPTGTPVRVDVCADDDWITITVCDHGVGIPADELPLIFNQFYRASTAIGTTGSGLGLAGARTIVEHHGGRINVESAVGRGTTVAISLPRYRTATAHDDAGPPNVIAANDATALA